MLESLDNMNNKTIDKYVRMPLRAPEACSRRNGQQSDVQLAKLAIRLRPGGRCTNGCMRPQALDQWILDNIFNNNGFNLVCQYARQGFADAGGGLPTNGIATCF